MGERGERGEKREREREREAARPWCSVLFCSRFVVCRVLVSR